MNNLTLIIPAKNESQSLPIVLDSLENLGIKTLVSLKEDDLDTINSIKNKKNIKLFFQSGKGYGNSLREAIEYCDTEYFCIFNADGSFDPSELKFMLEKVEKESYDFVFASRYEKNCGSDDDTIITLIGNYIFTYIGKIFFNTKISDILYTYVLGDTMSAKQLDLKNKDFSFCVELPIIAKRKGYKITTSKSYERSRIAGKKKVNAIRDGLLILAGMIKLFFKPK